MNRQQFLQEFLAALEPLSSEERQQISDYYEELICDGLEQGLSEQEILAKFGSPAEEAARFRQENPPMEIVQAGQVPYCEGEEVHTLDLRAENLRVRLVPSQNGQLQIHFVPNPERDQVESTQENGVWHFRHTMRKMLRNFFGFGMAAGSQEITVFVPEGFGGTLSIRTKNAKIFGSGFLDAGRLAAVTSNAPIEVDTLSPASCTLQTSNAAIRARDIRSGEFQATTSNAQIEGERVQGGKQVWKTSNGKISLSALSGDMLSVTTSNARIGVTGCHFPGEICLTSSNSAIVVERACSDHIEVHTSNGAITGTVLGDLRDYRTESKTSNGSCNLPNMAYPDQHKSLSATTSNARIKLDFIAE